MRYIDNPDTILKNIAILVILIVLSSCLSTGISFSITPIHFTFGWSLYNREHYTVSVKLPLLWSHEPELWFSQVEAQSTIHNITQQLIKDYYILASITLDVAADVHDCILMPRANKPYDAMKTSLIKNMTLSLSERMVKLLLLQLQENLSQLNCSNHLWLTIYPRRYHPTNHRCQFHSPSWSPD